MSHISNEVRYLVLLHSKNKKTVREIAKMLQILKSSVSYISHKFKKTSTVENKPKSEGPES